MAHPRKEIRDAVAALLVAANTAAGTRVTKTQVVPWKTAKLPALAVYTGTDVNDIESKQSYPREYRRNVEMTVEVCVVHTEALSADDALDAMELEVLRALCVDPTFGRQCVDSVLALSDPRFWEEGERTYGALLMKFDVFYDQTMPLAADVTLADDFESAGVTMQLSNEADSEDEDQSHMLIDTEE